jgi:ubiquinone/menaquinone biosynthesis C-methylase UbiE
MLTRVLEPEVMDSDQEARDYDAMDHQAVNAAFVDDLLAAMEAQPRLSRAAVDLEDIDRPWLDVLDLGTGTARIPLLLCNQREDVRIMGIDLSRGMLHLARLKIEMAMLTHRLKLDLVDAKAMPYPEGYFQIVMSNSIIHHIPEPRAALAEACRVLAPGGLLFVRDLLRPASTADLEKLVAIHAADANEQQRSLFAASLHAALSLQEIRALVEVLGYSRLGVTITSDRHWTWNAMKPDPAV